MRLPMLLPPDSIEFIISLDIPWFCSNRLPALCFVGVTISRTNSPLVPFLIGTTWWSIQHGGTTSSSSGNEEPLARKRRAKKTPEHQQNQLKTREKCWDNSNSVRPMKIANESPDPRTDETPTNEPNPSAVTEFFFFFVPLHSASLQPSTPKEKDIVVSVFTIGPHHRFHEFHRDVELFPEDFSKTIWCTSVSFSPRRLHWNNRISLVVISE